MLYSKIPYSYIEVENIVKNLKDKKITLLLSTQKNEGLYSLLNAVCNNLFIKNKKIAVVDLSTEIIKKNLNFTKILELKENNLIKKDTEIENYALYSFEKEILSIEDKIILFKEFPRFIESLKKENDFIFFINTPMIKTNKNNIQLNELKNFIDESLFIVRSNYISKIKLEMTYNSVSKVGIPISGIIINDFGSFNLFDEIERQINKIHFLFTKSALKKIKNYLRESKYNNQL